MCVQVYTVDIDNHTAVREAVYKVLQKKEVEQFIPYEFTQRVRIVGLLVTCLDAVQWNLTFL